jgi:hypothetical protein
MSIVVILKERRKERRKEGKKEGKKERKKSERPTTTHFGKSLSIFSEKEQTTVSYLRKTLRIQKLNKPLAHKKSQRNHVRNCGIYPRLL